MITKASHIFEDITFSAVKFTRGNEKKYELSFGTKISESLKNSKTIDLTPVRRSRLLYSHRLQKIDFH